MQVGEALKERSASTRTTQWCCPHKCCTPTIPPLNPYAVQVGEALKERAERIYKDYGNVMLETEGMTKVRR